MSMINISGIPNMGFAGGGGGSFAPSGIGQLGYNDLGYYGGGAGGKAGVGADQALYNNIFGNFGQQTDYYSGLGAAYGRATGGFGAPGSNPGWETPAPAADPWSGGAAPYQSYNQPQSSGDWWSQYRAASDAAIKSAPMGSVFDQGGSSSFPMNQPPVPAAPDINAIFALYGNYSPNQGFNQDAYNAMRGFQGVGVQPPQYQVPQSPAPSAAELGGGYNPFAQYANGGYNPFDPSSYAMAQTRAPQTNNMPNLGYNPGMQNWFANLGMQGNQFLNTFSNFPNSATPSQYTAQPYTNTQGQTFQPNMPPGFAPYFDVDHPQGALNWSVNQGGGV